MECVKTKRICEALVLQGAVIIPYVGGMRQPRGFPDRIVWHSRWQGWIEFKDWNTRVQPLQVAMLNKLNSRVVGSAVLVRFDREYWNKGTCDGVEWLGAKELLDVLSNG